MHKIKLRPVGLCYLNGVEPWIGNVTLPINTKFVHFQLQLNWPELMLPIKLFQFTEICELAVTDDL